MAAGDHHQMRSRPRRSLMLILTSMLLLVTAPSASAQWDGSLQRELIPISRVSLHSAQEISPPQKLRIEALNNQIPSHPGLSIPASGFSLTALGADPLLTASALDCMTAAIYYEAADEPITGQRAVAQVIINRVRHPAFPDTVCSVVFQGSGRATGCQFTFTCDGALTRRPSSGRWLRARAIAGAALEGYVEASVGHATHYHATYVLPHWAPNLTKLTRIGSHVFYQWKGSWSHPKAFTDRYAFTEIMPADARNTLAGYLLTSETNAPKTHTSIGILQSLPVPDISGTRAEPLAATPTPQSNKPAISATNLNVSPSQLIEGGGQLKDQKRPHLAEKGGTLAD